MISSPKWESLQERRARARVALFQKAYYEHVAIPMTLFEPLPMSCRGAHQKFIVPHCNTTKHENSFVPAVVKLWNTLPANITTISDPMLFRTQLCVVKLCTVKPQE